MDLLVIVPTRGRPENAARLHRVVRETSTAETPVLFCVDDNDPALLGYQALRDDYGLDIMIGSPRRLGPWLNFAGAGVATEQYGAIGFMGDDHVPLTRGWDTAVLNALEEAGPWGIAYGDDGYQGERLPTACFMRSELIRHLGYMVPPGLEHLYIDNAWKDIGVKSGGLRYLPEVKITHLHPAADKAEDDDTYRAANSRAQYAKDLAAYEHWQKTELRKLTFPG